ncbi:MAG: crossover junction endodeoxyribonuclease RuvC [Bacteroidales bacterium]|nr:crossover junction endodeoxyribonuclease RuvC [Bacteroidales bacterium]
MDEKYILGIDPGTNVMGYAVLLVEERKPKLVVMGVLSLSKIENHYVRLRRIHDCTIQLINEYHPDELAIESPFVGINPNSLIKLCRAQGVVISAAVVHDIPIFEYPPAKVKISIVGNGNASKEQVAEMVKRELQLTDELFEGQKLDATDALAIALAHHYATSRQLGSSSKGCAKSWKDFVSHNSDRVNDPYKKK